MKVKGHLKLQAAPGSLGTQAKPEYSLSLVFSLEGNKTIENFYNASLHLIPGILINCEMGILCLNEYLEPFKCADDEDQLSLQIGSSEDFHENGLVSNLIDENILQRVKEHSKGSCVEFELGTEDLVITSCSGAKKNDVLDFNRFTPIKKYLGEGRDTIIGFELPKIAKYQIDSIAQQIFGKNYNQEAFFRDETAFRLDFGQALIAQHMTQKFQPILHSGGLVHDTGSSLGHSHIEGDVDSHLKCNTLLKKTSAGVL